MRVYAGTRIFDQKQQLSDIRKTLVNESQHEAIARNHKCTVAKKHLTPDVEGIQPRVVHLHKQ